MAELKVFIENLHNYLAAQAELSSPEVLFGGVRYGNRPASEEADPVRSLPVVDASGAVSKEQQLDAFYQQIRDCRECPLAQGRKTVVFGAGNADARLMFVGEGPGREEDAQGLPFVGPAGRVLDRMITRLGFERDEVYIANIVKCRPPSNRDPKPEEIERCFPYLQKQIEIIAPQYIFCLGRIAAATLLDRKGELSSLRGRVHHYGNSKVFVTYHPAALLRNQKLFWATFEDMKLFRRVYDQEVGDKPPMENER